MQLQPRPKRVDLHTHLVSGARAVTTVRRSTPVRIAARLLSRGRSRIKRRPAESHERDRPPNMPECHGACPRHKRTIPLTAAHAPAIRASPPQYTHGGPERSAQPCHIDAVHALHSELRNQRGRPPGYLAVRRVADAAVRHQRHERREQLRRPRLHDGDRRAQPRRLRAIRLRLCPRVRRQYGHCRRLPVRRRASRPPVAQVADAAADHDVSGAAHLLPPGRRRPDRQCRPADHRRRARVHHDDAVVRADDAQRHVHGAGVLGRLVDDQPIPVRGGRRLCGGRVDWPPSISDARSSG